MIEQLTDCQGWFAEVAEAYVRYLVAKVGFEVFGQSEWGADLAIRDDVTNTWVRCEVRSSDCNSEPKRKKSKKLANRAEFTAAVTLGIEENLKVVFHWLNEKGQRIQLVQGGVPVSYVYKSASGLREWLRRHAFSVVGEPKQSGVVA